MLYIECGDGASGESTNTAIRANPQRLDNLEGKILRIVPDLNEHTATSTVSENGRYRIPNDNPFVATPGARKEIWAYGFRNPHRLAWAVDPANPANNRLIVNSVGLHTWETVYLVRKGANYGYGEREGNAANPRYVVSKFNDLRPQLLAEATKNARTIAQQFAADSGATVGKIHSANQGSIQIFGSDGNDESGPYSPTSAPVKKIRVVSTFEFELR